MRRVLLAGVLAAGAALTQPAGVAAQGTDAGDARALTVAANAAWRDTGIEIRRGEAWRIVSTGSWSAGPLCGLTDASGLAVEHMLCMKGVGAADFPVPEARIGALVGRIGTGGKPFPIGGTAGFIATADGALFLRSNDHDGYLTDNQGAIEVSVRRVAAGGEEGAAARGLAGSEARTVTLPANAAWRDTGIEIRRDEAWRVDSTGSWGAGPFCGLTDASGLAAEHLFCMKGPGAAAFPVPEARIGALVGRIGTSGKPFLIGGSGGFIATADGNLFLRSNDHDGYLTDNQGAIEISLRRLGDRVDEDATSRTAAAPPPPLPSPVAPAGAAAAGFADIHFGTYHALVVGNDRYRHLKPLRTARNDAGSVADLLRTAYGFRVTVLLDATRTEILGALANLRAALGPDDNLLIYYAGHGVVDSVTEQGYWLPVDAENRNPANWISNNDLTNMLRGISARHVMVVADSCYSGTLVRAASARLATGRDRAAWVRRMLRKRARTALVSGGLEPVLDGGGGGEHSVFAGAFLSALRENADVVDGQALFNAIKRPVVLNAEQTPEYSDIRHAGHEGGEFLFVRRGPK